MIGAGGLLAEEASDVGGVWGLITPKQMEQIAAVASGTHTAPERPPPIILQASIYRCGVVVPPPALRPEEALQHTEE